MHLAHSLLGPPTTVAATARLGTTGVDEHTVVTLAYASGALAIAHAAIRVQLPGTALVTGTDGAIEIPMPMHCPSHLDVVRFADGDRRRIDTSPGPAPFRYEIDEVHRCLAAGLMESPRLPWAASLAIADTLDRAGAAIGLVYPEADGTAA